MFLAMFLPQDMWFRVYNSNMDGSPLPTLMTSGSEVVISTT